MRRQGRAGLAAGCMLAVLFGQPAGVVRAATSATLEVSVIDLLTRAPLRGARVRALGGDARATTNGAGVARLALPTQAQRFSVRATAAGYLTTTETMLSPTPPLRVVIAMPPLDRLPEADALIRSAAAQAPTRRQRRVSPPVTLGELRPFAGGLTYPLPKTVDVKMTNGSIVTMDLEEYLKGVLPKEIGTSFPAEAKKAQAVAARTYTVSYTKGGTKAICTTTQCQVWSSTHYASTDQAVEDTRDQVAVYTGPDTTYNMKLAGGYFAASCGGATVNSEDGGWSFRPFLRGVSCIENKTGACTVTCQPSTCNNAKCPSSHPTCWGIFGHRIGLCQRGAQAMATCNKTYAQIVGHYYTDTQIANVGTGTPDGPSDLGGGDVGGSSDLGGGDLGGGDLGGDLGRDSSAAVDVGVGDSAPSDVATPRGDGPSRASLSGGCGCQTAGAAPGPALLGLLLIVALAARRRDR